jgi:archaellum biogenesis ATPase FlaH
MHTATESSHSYDFRKDFSNICGPGLHRLLDISADLLGDDFDAERRAGYAKSYVLDTWRTLKSEQQDADLREGIEPSPPMGSPPGTPPYIHPPWNAERAAAIVAEFEADAIDAEKRGAKPEPVDIDRAVRLGTEMARKQNAGGNLLFTIDTGPEAVAYATDRLKSKIERDAVYNPIEEVHAGLLSYRFLKTMPGDGQVVYVDHYKRRQLEPKPPAPTDDWLAGRVRNHGPLSIHHWNELFPRRTFRYALYRFKRLYDAERLTPAWMPRIPGVISQPLYYAPKPPESRKSAMTPAANQAITVPQAFGVVRKVAPEIFAKFKTTLAKLSQDTRDKECETAIRFAADVVADADVRDSSDAEVAKRALTECLRRSLRYVAPDNIVQFPGGEPEAAQRNELQTALSLLPIMNGNDLLAKSAAQVWFLVLNMIQGRKVNLLMGEDGAGKSFLMLQLAVAVATGGYWLGFKMEKGPVIFYTAEEEVGDLKVRLKAIAHSLGVESLDLSNLHLIPMGGKETAVLGAPVSGGKIEGTDLWRSLVNRIETIKPKLVIIDPLNEVFDGDELKRVQARQFVGLMRPIAAKHDLAIVVTGHPSKTGVNERTGTSGSTGWSAVFRARMYLEKILAEGNVTDTGGRKLFSKKLTGGERAAPIELITGEGGVLVREREPFVESGQVDLAAGLAEVERPKQAFLDLLAKVAKQGMTVSTNSRAGNYAPKEFVEREGGKGKIERIRKYRQVMLDLIDEGRLANEHDGAPSRGKMKLVAASEIAKSEGDSD